MPVNSITYQPATAQLMAAYRPVIFRVNATSTGGDAVPPYVVCDVYINDVYYKSLMRTAPETIEEQSFYQFDISDALQESLAVDIPCIGNNNIVKAPHTSAKVFCRFRASGLDADGFTVEEGTRPVQATKFTAAVPGSGTQSNSFFAINSALQHEDNQNLAIHLAASRTGTWNVKAYPLTHRKTYFFCDGDSDHYPFIFSGACLSADIRLNYRLKGQSSFQQATANDINICVPVTYTLDVTGNRVDVTLDDPLLTGETVLVQYKKQADSTWISAGEFDEQEFFFNVNGSDIAGDYDIRIIHFCTPCLSSDPTPDTFTLDGTTVNLAWRPVDPFCVIQNVGTVYITLELRNPTTDEDNIPNDIDPIFRNFTASADLYAKFFSDPTHLTPLNLTQAGLKIFVKKVQNQTTYDGTNTYFHVFESILTFIQDVAGTEVLLGNINTQEINENFSSGHVISSSTTNNNTFSPYPTDQLTGGNNGQKGYTTLEEYNTDTNIPTGNTKPNDSGDPDYVAPIADETTCPSGPDATSVSYGYGLEVSKVELSYGPGPTFVYATNVSNTGVGGYNYMLPIPKNTNVNVSIKVKTLDSGNTTGFVKVRVTHVVAGAYITDTFNATNNIETPIPATFQNIVNINISNY